MTQGCSLLFASFLILMKVFLYLGLNAHVLSWIYHRLISLSGSFFQNHLQCSSFCSKTITQGCSPFFASFLILMKVFLCLGKMLMFFRGFITH
uniref:Uncharacterized protein n=1 Tax=Anopheles darlingi TaxID=43151 RepID=A0A2M4D4W8_ANODA